MSGEEGWDVDGGVRADHLRYEGSDTDGAERETGDAVEGNPFAAKLVQIQLGGDAGYIGDGFDEKDVQHAMGVIGGCGALDGVEADVLGEAAEAKNARFIARFLAYLAQHALLERLIRMLAAAGQIVADGTIGLGDCIE